MNSLFLEIQYAFALLIGIGLLGLVIGLVFQNSMMNALSGALIAFRKPYKIGDLIESNDLMGTVEKVTLQHTHIKQLSGELVMIPNRMLIQAPLKNYSHLGSRSVELVCGISYVENLEEVKFIALEAIHRNVAFDANQPVTFYYQNFGDSSINFVIQFWIEQCGESDYLEAKSEAIIAIRNAFASKGIEIPFPTRTLNFGAKEKAALGEIAAAPFYKATNAARPKMVVMDN
ncbi:MAG: mechanosensitive ion channel family protein [Flammeovirgaceae bacterium]